MITIKAISITFFRWRPTSRCDAVLALVSQEEAPDHVLGLCSCR